MCGFRSPVSVLRSPKNIMIRNYIKIAFRNLTKNKAYALINILGLASSMAVATLIGLWIHDELSFNKSFNNYDRIGHVQMYQTFNGQRGPQASLPMPLAKSLKTYPDFEEIAQASWEFEHILAVGDNKFTKTGIYAEPNITKIFSLDIVKGVQNGLQGVNVIMINETLARSLFGETDPIGKTLKLDNKTDVAVTGIFKDFPHNSQFKETQFFIPWKYYLAENDWVRLSENDWQNNSFQCFALINEKANFEETNTKIKDLVLKNLPKESRSLNPEVFLHPMSKWQLYSEVKNGKYEGGRITFVWLFGIIGLFVLLLACINFMNLSTARSEKRAKEVGIRKAIGSVRGQLIGQFLSESFLTTFLAFLVSILLVVLSISWFNDLANKKIDLPFSNIYFWLISLAFVVLNGFLSGSYPALYLSSFEPVRVLKGTFKVGRFASVPRKVLVVIQFTVSVTLIIGTLIVYRQIQFARERPVGYDREGLLYVMMNTPDLQRANYETVRNDLINTGVVVEVSKSTSPVTNVWSNSTSFEWEGKDPAAQPLFSTVVTSLNYDKTVGMQMVQGRYFSADFKSDTSAIVINESAIKILGFKNPIGKFIKWSDTDQNLQVIGVAKDMVMQSPYQPTRPGFFMLNSNWASLYNVKLKPKADVTVAIEKVGKVFMKFNPGSPFDYKFVDEEFDQKFASETRIGKLASFFAILAIFISCLGLFGLASFVAEQRTKEIGVRKVLGATVLNLWQLLSKDFIYLVLIASLIAMPIAYYYLNDWLQKYEYRTEISWWIFIAAATGALLITLLTVSYQAIKAALMNPVKSLKTE
jgi:putative ABC transport system permease protein